MRIRSYANVQGKQPVTAGRLDASLSIEKGTSIANVNIPFSGRLEHEHAQSVDCADTARTDPFLAHVDFGLRTLFCRSLAGRHRF